MCPAERESYANKQPMAGRPAPRRSRSILEEELGISRGYIYDCDYDQRAGSIGKRGRRGRWIAVRGFPWVVEACHGLMRRLQSPRVVARLVRGSDSSIKC